MNILTVIRLIGTVFFLTILPVSSHALTPGQVFDKVKDAVVVVKTLDAQGKLKAQGGASLGVKAKLYTLQLKLVNSDFIFEFKTRKRTA